MSLVDAVGGVVKGLLGKGPVSAPDLSALFKTIDNAGQYQKDIINNLPASLQQQYADYKAANAGAATNLQTSTNALAQGLQTGTEANFDPNAPAVQASENAAKTAIYANVPSQQAAIREALAATGGFDRGTASKQLAQPVLQAGQQFGQSVLNTTAAQLQQKQQATQKALETVTTMGEDTAQKLFGMSVQQAANILQSGRQDLKDQLTELINQSNAQTGQTLGVQGVDIQNKYNQQVAENAQKDALTGAWVDLGTQAASSLPGFVSGLNAAPAGAIAAPTNYNPGGSYNQTVAGLGY